MFVFGSSPYNISRSMMVADVRPTRLARARQEVEDLLNGIVKDALGID